MAWLAKHRFAKMAPRKVNEVAGLIRTRDVQDAMNNLKLTHQRAARLIEKVLESAAANANEAEADMNSLYVSEVRVDQGPTMKRFRPKDRGRAHSILKRTCHITVSVDERKK